MRNLISLLFLILCLTKDTRDQKLSWHIVVFCCFFFSPDCLMRLYLYVSGDGRKVLLTTPTACTFLWESTAHENTAFGKNSPGRWTQVLTDESVILPSTEEKEIGVDAAFIQNEVKNEPQGNNFIS